MLAVDRQQGRATLTGRVGHQAAGSDQRLLVGERDGLSRVDRCHDWPEPCTADDGRDHEFRIVDGFNERLLPAKSAAASTRKTALQIAETAFVSDHGEPGVGPTSYVGERFAVRCSRDCRNLEPIRIAFDQVQRRLADRPGRAEDGDLARHVSPIICAAAVSTATGTSPSSRSRTPPCPGSQAPESLTPALRFIPLSNKSPACAAMASTGASASNAMPRPVQRAQAPPSKVAAAIPPYRPSTVLLGLTVG